MVTRPFADRRSAVPQQPPRPHTFGDLDHGDVPYIVASAADISTGTRIPFNQSVFNLPCSDLNAVRLSRAAAASSAVPVVLSTVTINNYGGNCSYDVPPWVKMFTQSDDPPRPAARAIRELKEGGALADGVNRPLIHMVDGGISDNVGMRGVLDALQLLEALHSAGVPTPLDHVKRIVVFVVNSLSVPKTNWDKYERPPNDLLILLKATGVPIDRYSYEAVELLKDMIARWHTVRSLRMAGAFASGNNPALARAVDVPDIELFAIDVSFEAHPDPAEREYLNGTPTRFALGTEQVDRLRAAAGTAIRASPDFQRLLRGLAAPPAPAAAVVPGVPN